MIPYISTSPDQLGVLSISLRKMSARPGQTYACVIGTAGSSSSREVEESMPGVGQMASHRPATGLRTLQPTLSFLSDTRAAHEPSSPPAHGNPPGPWCPASPQAGRDSCSVIPSATCWLSLFIEHRCPSMGLRSQAPGFQSALWEADRGRAGPGEASLPRSSQLLAQGLDAGTRARNPDGDCCHLIMRAYDISQKHLMVSCRLRQIKWRDARVRGLLQQGKG